MERTQDLVAGTKLYVKADGQISDAPLINNEEFGGGGLESVRGYAETEALGDCGVHCTVELRAPECTAPYGIGNGKLKCTPFIFYDMAHLYVLDPSPEQKANFDLEGVGVGVRGIYDKCLEYETCWATALSDSGSTLAEHTKPGDSMVNFRIKYLY